MAAPAIAASTTTAGSYSLTVPSGVASGSLLVARVLGGWLTSTVPTSAAFTAPSGWSFGYGQAFHDVADGAYGYEAWFYKYAAAADTGTYAFTANTVGGASPLASYGGFVARITGGPSSGNPFVDTLETSGTTTSSPGPWSVASFTPGGSNTLLLGGQFCFSNGSGTLTGPSGWTGVSTTASNGMGLFTLAQTTAAATGSLSFSAITDQGWAAVASIRAPSSGTPGTASGAVTIAGTAAAVAATSAAGTVTVTGTAGGAALAAASGPVALAGTSAGTASVASAGTISLGGAAAGAAAAAASGALQLGGAPAPAAATQAGGGFALQGVAFGRAAAMASGALALAGTASANTGGASSASGGLAIAGTAVPAGAAAGAGSLVLGGSAVGAAAAAASGVITISGLVGTVHREITVTGRLDTRRWSGSIGRRSRGGTLGQRRWKGSIG